MTRRTAAEIGSIEQVEKTLFAGNGYQRPVLERNTSELAEPKSRSWRFKNRQLAGVKESSNLAAFGASFSTVSPKSPARRIVKTIGGLRDDGAFGTFRDATSPPRARAFAATGIKTRELRVSKIAHIHRRDGRRHDRALEDQLGVIPRLRHHGPPLARSRRGGIVDRQRLGKLAWELATTAATRRIDDTIDQVQAPGPREGFHHDRRCHAVCAVAQIEAAQLTVTGDQKEDILAYR